MSGPSHPDVRLDLERILATEPVRAGRSKILYRIDDDLCLIQLVPSLSSFTYQRHEHFPGTEVLRLDFYELAAERLREAGLPVAFRYRVGPSSYVAEFCSDPPFEVIVKNVATGSTIRKYPGLFAEGHRFREPVVKFDFRVDPEDQPIAEDYVREAGYRPRIFRELALQANAVLRRWLAPRELLDFCLVIGERKDGTYTITSEISPDGMRLQSPDGQSLDKDLFRHGAGPETILSVWSDLVADLRARC